MNDSIAVVVDTNMLFKCFGLLKRLSESGAKVVIPRAVYEECRKRGNEDALQRLKKLRNIKKSEQDYLIKKRAKTLSLGLKFFRQLKERVERDEWFIHGSYHAGLIQEVRRVALENDFFSLSEVDLQVVATCVNIQANGLNGLAPARVKLLTFDRSLKRLTRKFNIELPRYCWKNGERKFNIDEILN